MKARAKNAYKNLGFLAMLVITSSEALLIQKKYGYGCLYKVGLLGIFRL